MVHISKGAAWMFATETPATAPQERKERAIPMFKETNDPDPPSAPKKKCSKRRWSDPEGAQECWDRFKKTDRGRCCQLKCAEKFASTEGSGRAEGGGGGAAAAAAAAGAGGSVVVGVQHHGRFLGMEQQIFRQFTCEPDRKQFVMEHVPLQPLAKGAGSMMAAGTPVCNSAFQSFFGVSSNLINACKGTPKARASQSATRSVVAPSRDHEKKDGVIGFLHHYQETFAQHMPNSEDSYLYLRYKNELYDEYEASIRSRFGQDNTGLDSALCSRDYFYKLWAESFPRLKLKPHGDFMLCQTCTLLKGAIYGPQAGCRGTQDKAELELQREKYESHVKDVSNDRRYSAVLLAKAKNAKANGVPWETVYLMIDAANQSNFATPLSADNAHGIDDKGYAERTKVYGVYVMDFIMNVFFTPQILGTGTNLVATAVYEQFRELTLEWGHPLGDVFLQVDNTVAENKNNYLMGSLAAMVARGIMKSVTLCFMMVGHTHIEIDQVFSCFSRAVKGRNIFTRQQLGDTFRQAYKKVPVQYRTLENLANFKDLVIPLTLRIPGITRFQAFLIYQEGVWIVVRVKLKMHADDWLGFSDDGKTVGSGAGFTARRLMHVNAVRLEGTPDYELKTVAPEILHQIDMRQQASWRKLPAAFPGDSARQELVKKQHADARRILRLTGVQPFPLDTSWLPLQDVDDDSEAPVSDDDDDATGGGGGDFLSDDDNESSYGDAFDGDERQQQQRGPPGKRQQHRRTQAHAAVDGALHTYSFLLSPGAPFLVGKVTAQRVVDGEQEVSLHWHTPRRALVENAATTSFDAYAGASFTASYTRDPTDDRVRGRPRLLPDVSWEPVSGIVASCSALNAGGKKIPAPIRQALKSATKAPSSEERGGGGGGGGDAVGANGGQSKERVQNGGEAKQSEPEQQEQQQQHQEEEEEEEEEHRKNKDDDCDEPEADGTRRDAQNNSRSGHEQGEGARQRPVEAQRTRTSRRGRMPVVAWSEGGEDKG